MTQQIWNDGVRSVEAFLNFIEAHAAASSAEVATRLLLSEILGKGSFPLHRVTSFDSKNLQHAMNILIAASLYSEDFRSDVLRSYRSRLDSLIEEVK